MGRDWGADDYKGWTRFGLCTEKNERAENEKTAINDKKFQMNWEGRDYRNANHLVCAVSLFGMKSPRKKIRGGRFSFDSGLVFKDIDTGQSNLCD